MYDEKIEENWKKYNEDMFKYSIDEVPYLFQTPRCNTCTHWKLITSEALHHIAISSPNEYDEIMECLEGKQVRTFRVEGKIEDVYSDVRFFGWCKRFPPVHKQDYSIIRFRTLFSLLNRFIYKRVGEYGFPLMPHDEFCGEWKKDDWVDDWIKEHKSNRRT
jgi:hypothetical protein